MPTSEPSTESTADVKPRRGLTRQAIVERALQVGNAEGLEAVSLRRLASEFGVTPMALYRHVADKQDLINAMTEVVLDELDVMAGIEPSMPWQEKVRRALQNYKDQIDARPLALPLSIAYNGDGLVSFWRMLDDLLGILLDAGFERRKAVVFIRVISNLLAGYLLLLRADVDRADIPSDPRQIELLRRRFELLQLSLPAEGFPNLVKSGSEIADVWLSDPDRWWGYTVELVTLGLEGLLDRSRGPSP